MTEEERFEYGELVEVFNNHTKQWTKRAYVGTMPKCKFHWVMSKGQDAETFDGFPVPYNEIRKIQKPDTTKQRIDSFEAKLNAILERYNKAMESMIKKLEEDND